LNLLEFLRAFYCKSLASAFIWVSKAEGRGTLGGVLEMEGIGIAILLRRKEQ
jgi:hypothetical protein